MPGPLEHVRVLDLSRLFPGPYASLLLADLGADVVKVEAPSGGDYLRYFPPAVDDAGGAAFWALNRGKRSVALDLQDAEQREKLVALIRACDVVIESFRPGVMEKFDLGPDAILRENPRAIVCRISGYGQQGPDRLRAGHDLNYAARAGVIDVMRDKGPLPVQVADLAGGAWPAALQICAALYGREQSGKGAVIDVSMTDGAHAMLIMPLARQALDASEEIADGNDLLAGAVPSYDVYPAKEGSLAVGALEPKFWMALCSALELHDLAGDGLSTGERGEEVRAILRERFLTKTASEWAAFLAPFDCCVEEVLPAATAHEDDPQLRTRALRVVVERDGASHAFVATPIAMTGATAANRAPPALGEHTAEVVAEWNKR